MKDYEIALPGDLSSVRINPSNALTDKIDYGRVYLAYKDSIIEEYELSDSNYNSEGHYYTWKVDSDKTKEVVNEARELRNLIIKILVCLIIDILLIIIWLKIDSIAKIPRDVISNRKLIGNLAKNDFKQKFAGSYLGTVWAFVQPIITVLVYWFVFEKALNVGTQSTKAGIGIPFVLWLIAGLVPWFFFSEVLSSGTNCLIEYNYLVKKVVFKISTLPVVKSISSLFVHIFFIVFTIILYSCYSYFPSLYTLQLLYYSFCMFVLSLGLIYAFSAIMVFFRDLSQIVNVLLQIGMWMTPIMWNMDAMANRIPGWAMTILKLNPMYYIVNGYRDALYNNVWFWERSGMTAYFWIVTIIVVIGGMAIFRKLQQHFADVL
ncbi:MAG: ABC transporter permease [Lachnospiraceae bacterium]|nr:ABC transporter permease [Lachnospiraceae bacterium]